MITLSSIYVIPLNIVRQEFNVHLCMPSQIDEQLIHNWIARGEQAKYKKKGETKWIDEQAEGNGRSNRPRGMGREEKTGHLSRQL